MPDQPYADQYAEDQCDLCGENYYRENGVSDADEVEILTGTRYQGIIGVYCSDECLDAAREQANDYANTRSAQ